MQSKKSKKKTKKTNKGPVLIYEHEILVLVIIAIILGFIWFLTKVL